MVSIVWVHLQPHCSRPLYTLSKGITISDPQIIITYLIGLAMLLYYCAQYLRHCPENASHLPRTVEFHKQVSLGIITLVLCSITFLGKELASLVVGVTSVVLSCSMYISPLSRLSKAIREKSAKDIPLPFAIIGLINTFSWVIHGFFVKKDFVLWLPCAIGVVSTSTQILLNILYRKGKRGNIMVPVWCENFESKCSDGLLQVQLATSNTRVSNWLFTMGSEL